MWAGCAVACRRSMACESLPGHSEGESGCNGGIAGKRAGARARLCSIAAGEKVKWPPRAARAAQVVRRAESASWVGVVVVEREVVAERGGGGGCSLLASFRLLFTLDCQDDQAELVSPNDASNDAKASERRLMKRVHLV